MKATSVHNTPRLEPALQLRWFNEGEMKCAWPTCGKPNPAGYFGKTKRLYICSHRCANDYYFSRKKSVRCAWCGKWFKPLRERTAKMFCSPQHFGAWKSQQADRRKLGRFAPLVHEFIEAVIPRLLSRSALRNLRYDLGRFFSFIRRKKLRSLERVGPTLITEFVSALHEQRPKSAVKIVGNLRLFFDWMIFTGKRKAHNPVVPRFYRQAAPKRLPRPYTEAEMRLMLSLIDENGDPQLKLAICIGCEAGLRISEVSNLRLSDVDVERQQLFVRLPNKTTTERFAPFHDRTKQAFEQWLKIRPLVDHDFVFIGQNGIPMREYRLRARLNRVLCGPGKFDSFSFHRLRHYAASRVYPAMDTLGVMRTFGWKSEKVMQGYTNLPSDEMRKSYARAMEQAAIREAQPALRSESIEAYFAASGARK